MTGASAAARAIFAQRADGAGVRSLQELHGKAPVRSPHSGAPTREEEVRRE
jgi:hypothetical protein